MKSIVLIMAAVCFYLFSFSQAEGMHFEKGMSWQQILVKAKQENKYIFMDCYTTWCGPCKFMAKNIFPLKETGDAVNPNYICVGIQIDSTGEDPESIKRMYRDARMIEVNYNIRAYPTFLYFNPNGRLVHRTVGSTKDAPEFISYTKDAMNPAKQYYTMIDQFRTGNRDTLMLESLTGLAIQNENNPLADSVVGEWLHLIKNVYSSDRLQMVTQLAIKPGTPEFDLFYHNAEKIDRVLKPGYAENVVMNAIMQHNPSIAEAFNNPASSPDWNQIYLEISGQYGPSFANQVVTSVKPIYYKRYRHWDLYAKSLEDFLKKYGANVSSFELNNYAWDIFKYCTSMEDLTIGLSVSERSLNTAKPEPGYIDTYANLLYKMGRTAEAIAKETEAMNLMEPAEKKYFQDIIDKMKSGAKTWD